MGYACLPTAACMPHIETRKLRLLPDTRAILALRAGEVLTDSLVSGSQPCACTTVGMSKDGVLYSCVHCLFVHQFITIF